MKEIMKHYIDKDVLVEGIKRKRDEYINLFLADEVHALSGILKFIDTLKVKEVEEKFDRPNIKTKDVLEVTSRMKYIDEDLKPIADFIMDYASWNLHKDEWNQPVLEVPLFRVLDALMQRGKPYCCAN